MDVPVRGAPRACAVKDCLDTRHAAKGYCRFHYVRYKNGTRLDKPRVVVGRVSSFSPQKNRHGSGPGRNCSYDGCDRVHDAKGYCSTHYQRLKNGVPMDRPMAVRGKGICRHTTCNRRMAESGFCKMHALRRRKNSDMITLGLAHNASQVTADISH